MRRLVLQIKEGELLNHLWLTLKSQKRLKENTLVCGVRQVGIEMTEFNNLSITDQLDWLCRKIIIHSMIYYDYNTNIISDQDYDKLARQLEQLVNENRDKISNCYYYECLKDYTAATGFDLKDRLEDKHRKYLEHLAGMFLEQHKLLAVKNEGRK